MADNDELPRFFKPFHSETASESMEIPLSFMEHLENPLPETAKLQGTGGRTWTVSFTKVGRQAYFTAGWSKFAEEHELENGEFLTFVYDGSRTFEVSVYDRRGCKVARAVAVPTIELVDSDSESHEEEEEDASMEDDDDEISANPSFQTSIKSRIHDLIIPQEVVRGYNLDFGETITYIDNEWIGEGKRKRSDDRVGFKGWNLIVGRNNLKQGDVVRLRNIAYQLPRSLHQSRQHHQWLWIL